MRQRRTALLWYSRALTAPTMATVNNPTFTPCGAFQAIKALAGARHRNDIVVGCNWNGLQLVAGGVCLPDNSVVRSFDVILIDFS